MGRIPADRENLSCRGNALVEFCIIASLVSFAILGVIDLGRAHSASVVLAGAAHAGAKYGAYRASQAADEDGIREMVITELAAIVSEESVAEMASKVVVTSQRYCECPNGDPVSCDGGLCDGSEETRRTYVMVRVEQPFVTLFNYPVIPQETVLVQEARLRAR